MTPPFLTPSSTSLPLFLLYQAQTARQRLAAGSTDLVPCSYCRTARPLTKPRSLLPSLPPLTPSAQPTGTDQLSGWSVDSLDLVPYKYSLCQMPLQHANSASAPTDPSPLVPPYLHALRREGRSTECAGAVSSLPDPKQSVFYRTALVADVASEPIQVSGLNLEIRVSRFWEPYFITGVRGPNSFIQMQGIGLAMGRWSGGAFQG